MVPQKRFFVERTAGMKFLVGFACLIAWTGCSSKEEKADARAERQPAAIPAKVATENTRPRDDRKKPERPPAVIPFVKPPNARLGEVPAPRSSEPPANVAMAPAPPVILDQDPMAVTMDETPAGAMPIDDEAPGEEMYAEDMSVAEMPADAMSMEEEPVAEVPVAKAAATSSDAPETSSPHVMKVYYVTDRKPVAGIRPGDWLRVHWMPLIAAIFLSGFVGMTLWFRRKVLFGVLAAASLVSFLGLGHDAMIEWQKRERLAAQGDLHYTASVRTPADGASLDYGFCHVNLPPNHQIGHLDQPSLIKLEFYEDPQKHIVLQRVIRSEKDHFYQDLQECLKQSSASQAFVFIHGYNVSFESAVKRTAQIAFDLNFDGAPICYSWPSHGVLENYIGDMANADSTVYHLQAFLEEVVERTGSSTIHLIAHSMGNRALMQALDRIAVSQKAHQPWFGQLVMAAPDVSDVDFQNRYAESAKQLTQRITLYASSRDRALQASTRFHGHNRAGLAGENLVLIEGIDTIDVSEIDTSLIGHSYYGDHPELIKDLRALVELAQPAAKRSWLNRLVLPSGASYWKFTELSASKPTSETKAR